MRRLPRLPLRRLPSLPRLRRRLRLRRWLRILLRVLGRLPPLLSWQPACRHDRLTNIAMADAAMMPGFQSFQKMLARELDMNVPAAMDWLAGPALRSNL
jgi:hypothetical protein